MGVKTALGKEIYRVALFFALVFVITAIIYFISFESADTTPSDMPIVIPSLATSTLLTSTSSVSGTALPSKAQPKPQAKPSATPSEQATSAAVPPTKTLSSWKSVMTTLFWVGEAADVDNAFITNTESYWDEAWQAHFGGVDDPDCRKGYYPCTFTPKENPFYFALPYAEYNEAGDLKATAKQVPWFSKDAKELLKNRWIAVQHGEKTCYAQWEDVGPNGEDDFSYVFGSGKPVNTFGERAGLDASPALWKCLGMTDNDTTQWAFVAASDVPAGPWRDIVTESGIFWGN